MAKRRNLFKALRKFAKLSPDVRERIVASVEMREPAMSVIDLSRRIERDTGVPITQTEGLFRALAPLVIVCSKDSDVADSLGEHLASVAAGQLSKERGEVAPDDDADEQVLIESLGPQISRLILCQESIGFTGKAQAVMWGLGRIFQRAAAITQVRPIFGHEAQNLPGWCVIAHELRIDYRHERTIKSSTFTMDSTQLESLKTVIERALEKEQALRSTNEAFKYLASEPEE